ncbi:hypothetical protein [Holdemania massiliensis]|uniref:hypothetical protein n=1 Tax=Holdemania massiliensis TaxID=1468449 RepID=UPI000313AE9A|nr:hypothetical protein [Holdemania massiliensis]
MAEKEFRFFLLAILNFHLPEMYRLDGGRSHQNLTEISGERQKDQQTQHGGDQKDGTWPAA